MSKPSELLYLNWKKVKNKNPHFILLFFFCFPVVDKNIFSIYFPLHKDQILHKNVPLSKDARDSSVSFSANCVLRNIINRHKFYKLKELTLLQATRPCKRQNIQLHENSSLRRKIYVPQDYAVLWETSPPQTGSIFKKSLRDFSLQS